MLWTRYDLFGKLIDMEEHKMTKQDKLVYTITLATIFGGIFSLGLIGLIVNIFG